MAVFIDTGAFLALYDIDDRYHQRSKELMKVALAGNFGRLCTSDYIIDEAITTLLVRTRKHQLAVELGNYLIESPRVTKLIVDQDVFTAAWTEFKALQDKGLSFTDCTSLALTKRHGIKQIMSFDCGFDGLTQRIC
jgi:uncharacterized protein